MIANMGDREGYDPTTHCFVTVDNQVTGQRRTVMVPRSRGDTLDRIFACFVEIDPDTDEMGWSDHDPLMQAPIGTCAVIRLHSGEIIIRIYPTAANTPRWSIYLNCSKSNNPNPKENEP